MRTLTRFPALRERVAAGHRAERWFGTADLPGLFRRPMARAGRWSATLATIRTP